MTELFSILPQPFTVIVNDDPRFIYYENVALRQICLVQNSINAFESLQNLRTTYPRIMQLIRHIQITVDYLFDGHPFIDQLFYFYMNIVNCVDAIKIVTPQITNLFQKYEDAHKKMIHQSQFIQQLLIENLGLFSKDVDKDSYNDFPIRVENIFYLLEDDVIERCATATEKFDIMIDKIYRKNWSQQVTVDKNEEELRKIIAHRENECMICCSETNTIVNVPCCKKPLCQSCTKKVVSCQYFRVIFN
jgi:hypothetical protein